jgi:hypothetical protein
VISVASGQILLSVARSAFHGCSAPAIGPPHHILIVCAPSIALQRRVARNVAILTTRVLKYGANYVEGAERIGRF